MIFGWHEPCLIQRVSKTAYLVRLLHLSVTGMGFCVTASLLILAAAPVSAEEPVVTLTMNPAAGKNSLSSNVYWASDNHGLFFNLIVSQPKAAGLNDERPRWMSSGIPVENQINFNPYEPLPLVRKSSHSNQHLTVQAGYGQVWDDRSMLEKISAGHQEPGLAFVSANLNF
jgi:hypothetical protein